MVWRRRNATSCSPSRRCASSHCGEPPGYFTNAANTVRPASAWRSAARCRKQSCTPRITETCFTLPPHSGRDASDVRDAGDQADQDELDRRIGKMKEEEKCRRAGGEGEESRRLMGPDESQECCRRESNRCESGKKQEQRFDEHRAPLHEAAPLATGSLFGNCND